MDREERITEDPRILGGKPTVRGLRIPVDLVVGLLNGGAWSKADILDAYPVLTLEDIDACQRYAATGVRLSNTTWAEFESMLDAADRADAEKRMQSEQA